MLGPNTNTAFRKLGDAVSANLNHSSPFDPFLDDPEGSTRSPPPPYRLPISDLFAPRGLSDSDDQDKTVSSLIHPVVDRLPSPTQSSNYSLTSLFLRYGVEPSAYYLPPDLLDEESFVACSSNCLIRHPVAVPRSSGPLDVSLIFCKPVSSTHNYTIAPTRQRSLAIVCRQQQQPVIFTDILPYRLLVFIHCLFSILNLFRRLQPLS